MKRKLVSGVCMLCIIVLGLTFIKGVHLLNRYFSSNKLKVLTECIEDNYLYDISEPMLKEGIYKGYIAGLENTDTYYLTSSEMKALKSEQDLIMQPLNNCLYVRLNAIKQGTSEKLKQALTNVQGLILDIRDLDADNIDEVQKICDLFLEEATIFKLQTKQDGMRQYTTTTGATSIPLILIVNQETKSGSEALMLALAKRAISVGSVTNGDPYIKKIIALEDGTGVSVAYGKLYDCYGRELTAVTPDVLVSVSKEELIDLLALDEIELTQDPFIKLALQKFNEARIIDKN